MSAAYNPSLQLQKLDPFIVVFCYVIYYKSSLKYYYYIKIYQECKKREYYVTMLLKFPSLNPSCPPTSVELSILLYLFILYSLFFIYLFIYW